MAKHPRIEGMECLSGNKLRMESTLDFILQEDIFLRKTSNKSRLPAS